MKTIKNKKCRMCDSISFNTVIDFGRNPLVNSLIEAENLDKTEPTFPLVVKQCAACKLVQIKDIIDADEIYRKVDYLYFSGDMPKLSEYFLDFARDVQERFLQPGDIVMEIGSNDGIFLNWFKGWGHPVLGIDPSSNVVVRALANGIPTISEFFGKRIAKSIVRWWSKAKVIAGSNCIAHINDLDGVMDGVVELLADDGVFIVECNYWGGMVKNKNYALIYHDHFSYFTVYTWINYAQRFGLRVFDALVTPAQGGSLRIFMDRGKREITERCRELIHEEVMTELNTYVTCQRYQKEVKDEAKKLNELINQLKAEGKKVAGYGAAAKGFSVLKLAKIDQSHIDYFVDDSPAKQGKYTPVTHIEVVSRSAADLKGLPDYFFITAPNYEDIIIQKELEFRNKGGKFITVDCRIVS